VFDACVGAAQLTRCLLRQRDRPFRSLCVSPSVMLPVSRTRARVKQPMCTDAFSPGKKRQPDWRARGGGKPVPLRDLRCALLLARADRICSVILPHLRRGPSGRATSRAAAGNVRWWIVSETRVVGVTPFGTERQSDRDTSLGDNTAVCGSLRKLPLLARTASCDCRVMMARCRNQRDPVVPVPLLWRLAPDPHAHCETADADDREVRHSGLGTSGELGRSFVGEGAGAGSVGGPPQADLTNV
jgi:hypothetical protein